MLKKEFEKKLRRTTGITLIALVVTIVVLIILTTVSINTVFSENGIIQKAQFAKDTQANAVKADEESLNTLLEEYANAMSEPKETVDTTAPNQATIVLSEIEMGTEENITATITQSDGESGVNIQKCKWVLNTNSETIINESEYTGTFNTESQDVITLYSTVECRLVNHMSHFFEKYIV